jgi:hypothetical protein
MISLTIGTDATFARECQRPSPYLAAIFGWLCTIMISFAFDTDARFYRRKSGAFALYLQRRKLRQRKPIKTKHAAIISTTTAGLHCHIDIDIATDSQLNPFSLHNSVDMGFKLFLMFSVLFIQITSIALSLPLGDDSLAKQERSSYDKPLSPGEPHIVTRTREELDVRIKY